MLRFLGISLLAASLRAGVVQGVVLEYESGRPLARTVVRLDPVPKSSGDPVQPITTRVTRVGQFVFPAVAPGLYHLMAVRAGYFPAAYGQRLPTGRSRPIEVTAESKLFAELRLRHKGAITGRVLDENGVASAGVSVLAYRARLPLRAAGSAVSDDRGLYRIYGLDPGKYWVRSAAHPLEDVLGWLPTFAPQAREVRDARVNQVGLEADAVDVDVRPEFGTLFRLGGLIGCDTTGPVIVTLSSETGRRRAQSACGGAYKFDGLAPAAYEVFATMVDGSASGFTELFLDRDTEAATVQLLQPPVVDIEVRRAGSNAPADIPVTLTGRRQDLSETEDAREIAGKRATLHAGNWEFRARPPAGQFVESISTMRGMPRRPWKAERVSDWFEVFIEPRFQSRIRITVSDRAAQFTGTVLEEGKPVPGAPVFLWPVAESARRSLAGSRQLISDTDGGYRFDSLPPGDYRLLASFDVNEVDEETCGAAGAPVLRIEASQTLTQNLTLWTAP